MGLEFDPAELKVVDKIPETKFCKPVDIYDYPVDDREAVVAMYERRAVYQPIGFETVTFCPSIFPDNISRGFVFEDGEYDPLTQGGGPDMFGVNWVYVPSVGGSMEDPNQPHLLEDVNDWKENIKFPDVDSWDWEGSAKKNNGTYLQHNKFNQFWIQTGWFERLISFMGFEEALVAVVDEDQEDACAELFMALADLYIDIIDHAVKYYDRIDGLYIHDDWGSANNALFRPEVAEELIVPAMRKVTDRIHELGLYCEFHSCGKNEKMVPNMIKAGWDVWMPQAINDIEWIYREYGDKIILGTVPQEGFGEDATEEEQRACARKYVETFCHPNAPTYFSVYGAGNLMTPAFREELYVQSRKAYCG